VVPHRRTVAGPGIAVCPRPACQGLFGWLAGEDPVQNRDSRADARTGRHGETTRRLDSITMKSFT